MMQACCYANGRQLRKPSIAAVIQLLRDDIDMLKRRLGSDE
jgi:hypothetical protein